MKIKNYFIAIYIAMLQLLCLEGSSQTLTVKAPYPAAEAADGAISFTLGTKIYVGGGFLSKKFYEYDVPTNTWTKKNNLPGVTGSRCYGTAFTVNGKGYIGLGFDLSGSTFLFTPKKDLWEYDPSADSWTQKANFPGTAEDAHFSFVINDTAYVGGGEVTLGSSKSELYRYDAVNDNWAQKTSYPDIRGIASPFTFVHNNKAYISCGMRTDASTYYYETTDTYEYDPANDGWVQKSNFPGNARQGGIAFTWSNTIYCGMGYVDSTSTFMNDFYTYSSASNQWSPSFTTTITPRAFATAATAAGRLFLGLGFHNVNTLRDWYEFNAVPTNTVNAVSVPENPSSDEISLFPLPFEDQLFVSGIPGFFDYTVYTLNGEIVQSGKTKTAIAFNEHILPGIYLLEIKGQQKIYRKKIIKT